MVIEYFNNRGENALSEFEKYELINALKSLVKALEMEVSDEEKRED